MTEREKFRRIEKMKFKVIDVKVKTRSGKIEVLGGITNVKFVDQKAIFMEKK